MCVFWIDPKVRTITVAVEFIQKHISAKTKKNRK